MIHFVNKHVQSIGVDHLAVNLKAENAFYSSSIQNIINLNKDNNDNVQISIYYLGTGKFSILLKLSFYRLLYWILRSLLYSKVDGKVIKMSNLEPKMVISEWKLAEEPIKSIKIRQVRVNISRLGLEISDFKLIVVINRVIRCLRIRIMAFTRWSWDRSVRAIMCAVCACVTRIVDGIWGKTHAKTSNRTWTPFRSMPTCALD